MLRVRLHVVIEERNLFIAYGASGQFEVRVVSGEMPLVTGFVPERFIAFVAPKPETFVVNRDVALKLPRNLEAFMANFALISEDVIVMVFDVNLQPGNRLETFAANLARDPLGLVDVFHVAAHFVRHLELFPAQMTGEVLFQMSVPMPSVQNPIREFRITNFALGNSRRGFGFYYTR